MNRVPGIPNDTEWIPEDVKYYLQHLYQQYSRRNIPSSYPPIYIAGFSLGADVALKCIGELVQHKKFILFSICLLTKVVHQGLQVSLVMSHLLFHL